MLSSLFFTGSVMLNLSNLFCHHQLFHNLADVSFSFLNVSNHKQHECWYYGQIMGTFMKHIIAIVYLQVQSAIQVEIWVLFVYVYIS